MGKSLVINGINAAPANLGQVELVVGGLDITGTLQTKGSTSSGYGAQYLHFPSNYNDCFQSLSNSTNKIGYIDVSQYVGQTLMARIEAGNIPTNYTPNAYWRCFASAMTSASISNKDIQNAATAVQRIGGVGGSGLHDFYLPIPEGAVYFIFDYKVANASEYRFVIL